MEALKQFLQKQRYWLIAVLVLAISSGAVWYFFGQGPPEPSQLLSQAWEKSLAEDSYSFSSKTNLQVDGKQRSISNITGQIQQNNFHIRGTIINTKVEVYRIGKTVYLKDVFEGKEWKVFEDGLLQRQALVMAEIDPLSYLQFKNILELNLAGTEQLGERTVYRLETRPQVNNQFLDSFYTNFRGTFWIGKWDKRIWKAVLEGEGKQENADKIRIEVLVLDYGHQEALRPPITSIPAK